MSFMTHDAWRDALFLHWRIPPTSALGEVVRRKAAPFRPDVIDGDYWIGLVLLTEVGVGPGRRFLCCSDSTSETTTTSCSDVVRVFAEKLGLTRTHFGANLRTYVEGDGIFFFSLECDSRLATLGANVLGIPYRLARMGRWSSPATRGNEEQQRRGQRTVASAGGVLLSFRGARLGTASRTSTTTTRQLHGAFDNNETWEGHCARSGRAEFRIACDWRVVGPLTRGGAVPPFSWGTLAAAFVERYCVYTRATRFGCTRTLRGEVAHAPWPLARAEVDMLEIQNPDVHEVLGPVLERVLCARGADHAVFSAGVGPIDFGWLGTYQVPS